jgi:hypothetical protein
MIDYPLCQKCAMAIVEWNKERSVGKLVGCKECDKIKSFADAIQLCPLIGKKAGEKINGRL